MFLGVSCSGLFLRIVGFVDPPVLISYALPLAHRITTGCGLSATHKQMCSLCASVSSLGPPLRMSELRYTHHLIYHIAVYSCVCMCSGCLRLRTIALARRSFLLAPSSTCCQVRVKAAGAPSRCLLTRRCLLSPSKRCPMPHPSPPHVPGDHSLCSQHDCAGNNRVPRWHRSWVPRGSSHTPLAHKPTSSSFLMSASRLHSVVGLGLPHRLVEEVVS